MRKLNLSFKHSFILTVSIAVLLISAPSSSQEPGYVQYDEKKRDVRVTGRIYHPAPGRVLVEVWPRPFKKNIKVNKISLTSPSGKRYQVREIENFPLSQTPAKRSRFLESRAARPERETLWARIDDWLIPEALANCSSGHIESGDDSSGDEGVSIEDAASFAAFGGLMGLAATQEKHWVSAGAMSVAEEPGEWKATVEVIDDKGKKHRFSVPFFLSYISTPVEILLDQPAQDGRVVASASSTDSETGITTSVQGHADGSRTVTVTAPDGEVLTSFVRPPRGVKAPPKPAAVSQPPLASVTNTETGLTTTVVQTRDGSRTVTVTGEDGNVISTVTMPPRDPSPTVTYDPKTGYTTTVTEHPDGSVTTHVEDKDGNWVEGHRWPGGRKKPVPEPEPEEPPPPPDEPVKPPVVKVDPEPEPEEDPPGEEIDRDPPGEEPPQLYGEELEVELNPIGILLLRDDDFWIPEHKSDTTVTAQIYEKPPGSRIWVISNQKRYITSHYDDRSDEKGMALNKKLDNGKEKTPDVFTSDKKNSSCQCSNDEGLGYHFRECKTKEEKSRHTYTVSSEDYGSFSQMYATCPDCVQLQKLDNGDVVEADVSKKEHLAAVPKDDNDNQIADFWEDIRNHKPNADDDDEKIPQGNLTEGDGYSAYEEYRGFFDRADSHLRTDWKKKTLFIHNPKRYPGILTFQGVSELEVWEINEKGRDDKKVVNFNADHATRVVQHCLVLDHDNFSGKGVLGYTYLGPPKKVDKVYILPQNHTGGYSISDTVVHELGHAIGIDHHGNITPVTKYWYPKTGTWRDWLLWRNIHTGNTYCGINLPGNVDHGTQGDQSSGVETCYLRYEWNADVYRLANGTDDCMQWRDTFTQYCSTSAGSGINAGARRAGNASNGDCKSWIIVNDK